MVVSDKVHLLSRTVYNSKPGPFVVFEIALFVPVLIHHQDRVSLKTTTGLPRFTLAALPPWFRSEASHDLMQASCASFSVFAPIVLSYTGWPSSRSSSHAHS